MTEAILLNCKPANLSKGVESELFVYEHNEIKSYIIKTPHIFCTKRMSEGDARTLQRRLAEQFRDKPDVQFSVKPSGRYCVIQAMGPRELKSRLPELFVKDERASVSQKLDWFFPPFSKITIEGDKAKLSGTASLEELLQLDVWALDWELDKNGKDYYSRINTGATASKTGAGALSIFDAYIQNQEQLVAQVESFIQRKDPPILTSHNISFDLMQPRDKIGAFEIGFDNSSPIIKGRIGKSKTKLDEDGSVIERKGFLKVELAGRQLFCSMSYARNNLWCTNNKLETVANFLGKNYEKSISYGELETLVQEAARGNIVAREKIKAYCAEDAQIHLELANRLLPLAFAEALAFETNLMNVCFNSKSTLARKLRDKRYFQALNTYRPNMSLYLQEFDIYEEKLARFVKDCKLKSERGYVTEPLIVVFPTFLEQAFSRVLTKEPAALKLKAALSNATSAIDKIVLHRDLEALCEEPLYDLNEYVNTRKANLDKIFYGKYKVDPNKQSKELSRILVEFSSLLNKADVDVINYNKRFLFLKPRHGLQSAKRILQNSNLIEFYGITDAVISGHSGRILASVNKTAITSALDIYGRRGLRTDFEREIYSNLLDFITNKTNESKLFVKFRERFVDLAQNKISKIDLIYYTNTELEPWEYSWPAQKHERVKALTALGVRKGEQMVFGYGIGPDGIHKRYLIEDFFNGNVKPDIAKYWDEFFGYEAERGRSFPNGTISDLIYSICPARKEVERKELQRFLEGKGDLSRWDVYEQNHQNKLF